MNRKKAFYAVCLLDIVEIVLLTVLSFKVSKHFGKTMPNKGLCYKYLYDLGYALKNVPWQEILVYAFVPLHWFAMRMILKIKKNGKSAWELLK